MKKIIVATDYSACAANAVDFAVQSAKVLPAEIILLHAFEIKGNIYTDYMGVNHEYSQSLLNDAQNKLQQLTQSIKESGSANVSAVLFRGSLNDGIVETSLERNADLVVMGTLGASGLKEKLRGSRTASVIGSSYIPVLVIPDGYVWKKPEKLLVTTNHFEKEPSILDFVFEVADLYMAQVNVVVFTDEDDDNAATFLEHQRKTPQYEKILKQQYNEEGLTVTHLYGTEFDETLQKHITENGIDMLVMITYQKEKGFWDRMFNPSKTKQMSYHTKIPLLAIPAK